MKPDYTRYYQNWHDDSPAHLAEMQRHFRGRLTPHLPPDRECAVLDVGCGMGFALETFRSLGYTKLEGIDADENQVAAAIRRNLRVTHVADSPRWLRARAATYHVVLLLDVLEHVPRGEHFEFLAAIHAALLPGGKLICSVPNASSTLASRQRYNDWTHRAGFTEHSLDFALYHSGFRQIAIQADDGAAPRMPWLPRWRMRWWYVRGFFRAVRRLQLMAELGPVEGRTVPLSLNLLGVATK